MGTVYNKMGGSGSVSAVQDFPLRFSNIPANGQVNQVVTISGNTILSYGLVSMTANNATTDQKRIRVVVNLEQLSNTQIDVKCSGNGWGYSNVACNLTLRVWYK